MTLAIRTHKVNGVLLADGWHDATDFDLDSYEFIEEARAEEMPDERQRRETSLTIHGGGNGGICATGFVFRTDGGVLMMGPLTSILAVRTGP